MAVDPKHAAAFIRSTHTPPYLTGTGMRLHLPPTCDLYPFDSLPTFSATSPSDAELVLLQDAATNAASQVEGGQRLAQETPAANRRGRTTASVAFERNTAAGRPDAVRAEGD